MGFFKPLSIRAVSESKDVKALKAVAKSLWKGCFSLPSLALLLQACELAGVGCSLPGAVTQHLEALYLLPFPCHLQQASW